uniref:Uncharacterized protein n=1 Tax=Rhizophora mucronata TaxID=61149 RepID=A0A2P2PZJ8_RHIMU
MISLSRTRKPRSCFLFFFIFFFVFPLKNLVTFAHKQKKALAAAFISLHRSV